MKYTIKYVRGGTPEFPFDACIRLEDGSYAIGIGTTQKIARDAVIQRAKLRLGLVPPPEEIEIEI